MTLYRFPCPPGLIGATLFYWGWQLNQWPVGLIGGLILEAASKIPWRIEISEKQFIIISDLTSVAIAITGVLFFINYSSDGLFYLVQWLPAVMFVLLTAQSYSEARLLPLTAIVATLRKRSRLDPSVTQKNVDLRLPYIFITLIAASTAAPRTQTFYFFSGVSMLWFLWNIKPRHHKSLVWLLFSASALSLGLVLHIGVSQLQGKVQEITTQWLQADWSQRNLNRNSTAIGQIGLLKMSEEIIMRIRNNDKKHFKASTLLQQAEYNRYASGSWHVDNRSIETLPKQPGSNTWYLSDYIPATRGQLSISTYLQKGEGVLALPRHSFVLQSTAIKYDKTTKVSINKYGSVRIENAPGLLDFTVEFATNDQQSETVSDKDLEIPPVYRQLMTDIVNELGLDKLTPAQATQKLRNYFADNFKYTLVQNELDLVFNPLNHFLRKSRKGHCEYFATAGALILRAAGIPTRYASGFLMSEYDAKRDLFIVRARHAHAWTLAYVDGNWIELDYTPSTWAALEAAAAPWWEDIYDIISHLTHGAYQWWTAKPRDITDIALVFALLAVSLYLLKKVHFNKVKLQWKKNFEKKSNLTYPGSDSPFYKIIQHLEQNAAPKHAGESIKAWLQRIAGTHDLDMDLLEPLVERHYQYRFNSRNKNSVDKQEFKRNVESWLELQTGR